MDGIFGTYSDKARSPTVHSGPVDGGLHGQVDEDQDHDWQGATDS
jgi:hypothetical protein